MRLTSFCESEKSRYPGSEPFGQWTMAKPSSVAAPQVRALEHLRGRRTKLQPVLATAFPVLRANFPQRSRSRRSTPKRFRKALTNSGHSSQVPDDPVVLLSIADSLIRRVSMPTWKKRHVPNENQHGCHPPLTFEHTLALAVLWLPDAVPICV